MNQPVSSQFALMRQRRYAPFYWVCFLGTFNDNLLKFAITLMLTYQLSVPWLPPEQVGPLLGALFTVPSLLLSAWFGMLADKHPLDALTRLGKSAEVLMMGLAAWAVWAREPAALVACVLLSGVHVTWFSTVKYAYMPRHLAGPELVGGNGLMEMGLFTAILLGTLVGGAVADQPWAVVAAVLGLAVLGRVAAGRVPHTPAAQPGLPVKFNPITQSWQQVRSAAQQGALPAILGISWMWFFGATYMMLFPALTREVYRAEASVASALLAVVSIGIALGALCTEALAHRFGVRRVVALGAGLMAVCGGDIAWQAWSMGQHIAALAPSQASTPAPALIPLADALGRPEFWRSVVGISLMSMGVGLFSVPLYARMQAQASPDSRARVVSANNVLNAVSMVLCAALAGALQSAGMSLGGVLGVTVALHLLAFAALWRAL